MSLLPLLALPLVGGYAFSVIWKTTHYVTARESGHKLYFRAIFYGVFLFLACTGLHIIFYYEFIWYRDLISILKPIFSGEQPEILSHESRATILIESFFAGPVLGFMLNFPAWRICSHPRAPEWLQAFSSWAYEKQLFRAIANNDFELLMFASATKEIPVMFTMETNKVYVGTVNFLPNPAHERKSVRIMPFLSGYRDPTTQEFSATDVYYPIIKPYLDGKPTRPHLSIDDFDIILPASQIVSAHLFDITTYLDFLKQKSQKAKANNNTEAYDQDKKTAE